MLPTTDTILLQAVAGSLLSAPGTRARWLCKQDTKNTDQEAGEKRQSPITATISLSVISLLYLEETISQSEFGCQTLSRCLVP